MSSINKGFNLRVAELEETLVKDINSSGLPLISTKNILETILNQCIAKLQIEIANEKQAYDEAVKKEQEEAEKEEEKAGDE